ncbi:hypothetical protein J6590_092699 [Homalodisca vitripennis]|nr:hypothetical protein J6590_092699 [Homalodisca vitripennis]
MMIKMDDNERRRLLDMLSSVEKEERELERLAEEDRQLLRRQLFANLENNPDNENTGDVVIEREGSDQSDDEVEQSDHGTSSETSLEDVSEREEEITEQNQNRIEQEKPYMVPNMPLVLSVENTLVSPVSYVLESMWKVTQKMMSVD